MADAMRIDGDKPFFCDRQLFELVREGLGGIVANDSKPAEEDRTSWKHFKHPGRETRQSKATLMLLSDDDGWRRSAVAPAA
ncbi:hypothetical protein NL676_005796 [Syzygium grande]|nr:hypothetical protein NL676_005796 [Syzygium grande]